MSRLKSVVASLKAGLPKYGMAAAVTAVMAVGMVEPTLAGTGEDASAVAQRVEGQLLDIKSLAVSIAFLLGIVLFIAGLWMLYKDSKQPGQGHAKNGMIAMLVGAGLLVVQTLVGITAQSVTNNGDEATTAITADDAGF